MEDRVRKEIVALIPRLRRQARFMVHDPDLADDIVQDTLARAINKIDSWQPGTNLGAWLSTILRNVVIGRWRQNRDRGMDELTPEDAWIPPGQETSFAIREMRGAVRKLSPDHRQLLLLIAVEGFTYEEASEILQLPVGTVRSRLSRARAALREILGERQHGDGSAMLQSPIANLQRQLETEVEMAERHVREAEMRVIHQRAMIEIERARNLDVRLAEELLHTFEDGLANLRHRLIKLRELQNYKK